MKTVLHTAAAALVAVLVLDVALGVAIAMGGWARLGAGLVAGGAGLIALATTSNLDRRR